MTEIHETPLPGVGIRHDFETKSKDRIGVISHHSGRRDLLVYDRYDPDACLAVLRLAEDESIALTEILGANKIADPITNMRQSIDGITIDWVPIEDTWLCAGQALRDTGLRAETGVSVVAVMRDGKTIISPNADFELHVGDTAVVVGTAEGVKRTFEILRGE